MKKFLSLLLTLSCVFAFTIPAFAAENTSDSSFENDVIFAEVSDGSIQEYSASNIIVMTPDQVLELGTEIPSIVETSKMVLSMAKLMQLRYRLAALMLLLPA